MQVLLNNLFIRHDVGPNQELAADVYFGIHTQNDVVGFNLWWNDSPGQLAEMTPLSWGALCGLNFGQGFRGPYGQTQVAPPSRTSSDTAATPSATDRHTATDLECRPACDSAGAAAPGPRGLGAQSMGEAAQGQG